MTDCQRAKGVFKMSMFQHWWHLSVLSFLRYQRILTRIIHLIIHHFINHCLPIIHSYAYRVWKLCLLTKFLNIWRPNQTEKLVDQNLFSLLIFIVGHYFRFLPYFLPSNKMTKSQGCPYSFMWHKYLVEVNQESI